MSKCLSMLHYFWNGKDCIKLTGQVLTDVRIPHKVVYIPKYEYLQTRNKRHCRDRSAQNYDETRNLDPLLFDGCLTPGYLFIYFNASLTD